MTYRDPPQRQVVIFGTQDFASLAHLYIRDDSDRDVVAFTVDRDYLTGETFEGLPLIAYEDLGERYATDEVVLFAPMAPTNANHVRQRVFERGRSDGWSFMTYVSSRATTFADLDVGSNCFILEDNTIQPYVSIGDNVVLWSGNHIGHHSTIEDHVFVASHAVISGHCRIGANSNLGVNCTLRDGTVVGEGSIVGMGANVVRDTEPFTVNVGNPAKPTGRDSRDSTQ